MGTNTKMRNLLGLTLLALVAAPALQTAAAIGQEQVAGPAEGCEETNHGWGWEYPECNYVCGPNKHLHVSASVDDDGYVSGWNECDFTQAHCTSNDGFCHGSSHPYATGSGGAGTCSAQGNGGGAWTRAYVSCSTSSAGSRSTFRALLAPAAPDLSVHMVITRDGATAWQCVDGGACVVVEPACAFGPSVWTCRVGA